MRGDRHHREPLTDEDDWEPDLRPDDRPNGALVALVFVLGIALICAGVGLVGAVLNMWLFT